MNKASKKTGSRKKPGQRAPKGRFEGNVLAEWLADGRKMKLIETFAYIDRRNVRWEAPAGSEIDGASIPQLFWSFYGSPYCGLYRRATVLHDVYCEKRTYSPEKSHRMFYEACLDDGVDQDSAEMMHSMIKYFGPHWDKNGNDLKIDHSVDEEEW